MKTTVCIFFLLPLFATAQQRLTINGKLKGLKNGTIVMLADVNQPGDTLASAVAGGNGTFLLKKELKEPTLVNLTIGDKSLMTFLGNTAVSVTGDVNQPDKIKITGSPTHNDFKDFQKHFDPLFNRLLSLNQRYQQGDRSDSVEAGMENGKAAIQQAIDEFLKTHRSSAVSAFVLVATIQLNDDILRTESRMNSLKPSALGNAYGLYLKQVVAETKITAVGGQALDFTQTDTAGVPVSLSSFRGKYVLVDFWASWCGPCRQENPNVVMNYNKFNSKNFTVLGVSLDRPGQRDRWLQAIHADHLTWTHVSDLQYWNNAVAQQYKVQSIPQNFLIGPDGRIVAKNLRGSALEAKLCELLGCN